MKNKIIRTFTVTLAAVLCLTAFSTTAFAGGTDPNPEPLPETTEAPQEEEPTTGGMEPEGVPVTPEGNATLVDDFYGDKQLITVTTKAGNYFYILIDRANEDKETSVQPSGQSPPIRYFTPMNRRNSGFLCASSISRFRVDFSRPIA